MTTMWKRQTYSNYKQTWSSHPLKFKGTCYYEFVSQTSPLDSVWSYVHFSPCDFLFFRALMHYTWKNCGRSLGVSKVCQCSGIGMLMRVFKFSDLLPVWRVERGLWGSFLSLGTLIIVCSWLSLCGHSSPLFSLCSSPDS